MQRRLICLHGHFYQPPRENPWIEEVEVQDSAGPFHDWNARIAAECYGPNGAARIKDPGGRIVDIVNNYRHLSFNFGPTLLTWMERRAPDVYRSILDADASSVVRRGHGNALAQGYSHAILPLCSPRDRRTEIRWGLADFAARFGRRAEGFWLPETAADEPTLAALADEGVRFTVLSPYQAARVRPPGGTWQDARGGRFDPSRPYVVRLGGGRAITVFFYDGPIARSLAFGEGLASGDELMRQLVAGFDASRGHDELLAVAVDGETFGHHKKGGDEVLAVALRRIGARKDLGLVNFGQALDVVEAEWEAEILPGPGSSWSCAHGVERWRGDCGCQASGQAGWRQGWRAPLREALDRLRDRLVEIFESEGGHVLADPWRARDEYVELVLDPERRGASAFLARHQARPLSTADETTALTLLEMQRQALLMYTSCGWFFAEISGLETVQVLKYAARAIQLARDATGVDLEESFKQRLAAAPSNLPQLQHGGRVYEQHVLPSVVTLEGVAAHYAIASLFDEHPGSGRIFCYRHTVRSRRRETSGPATLAVGRLELQSLLTRRSLDASFCVLHFGGADFRCGLRPFTDAATHAELERSLVSRLEQMSLAQVLREIDRAFTGRDYTLRDLFLDERRRMAGLLLRETLRACERDFTRIFESNRRLMEFLREIDSPIPTALRVGADVGLSRELAHAAAELAAGRTDVATAHAEMLHVAHVARSLGARLDVTEVAPRIERLAFARVERLEAEGRAQDGWQLVDLLDLAARLGLPIDLWKIQNRVWDLARTDRGPLGDDVLARLAQKLWLDEGALIARARRAAPHLEGIAGHDLHATR